MDVAALIKKEMTPKTVTLWGQPHENHIPTLIDEIQGDGQCLIYIVPLATRPDYYIMRVDSSVQKMIEDDDDEIRDFLKETIYEKIEEACGTTDVEDDDGNEIHRPFPALDLTCGTGWGLVE